MDDKKMAGLIIRKLVATDVEINDLGITITGALGADRDITHEDAENVSLSTDLVAAINAGELIVLDPRDGTNPAELSIADSVLAIEAHNQTHFGITGGRFGTLDDPDYTPTPGQVLVMDANGEAAESSISDIITGDADFVEDIQDIVGGMVTNGVDTTAVYDDAGNALQIDVNDVFLRNSGDVLDSGTLVVAAGATIEVATGADLTIADAPVNPLDAVNKEYVDMIAAGNDVKDPVVAATTAPVSLTATSATVDGVTIVAGDRVLVKNQTDPTENGIYTYDGTGLVRATDQDGDTVGEVSAANQTFVAGGAVNGGATFSVSGTGDRVVGTDDIIWVQTASTTTYSNGTGILMTGTQFSLDVETLPVGTITTADEMAFNDTDGGNSSAKSTVANFLADLDIVVSSGVGGFAVETAANVFTNRTLQIETTANLSGLSLVNGDGVSGDPTFGLDIQNLPVQTALDATDRIAVWDATADANVYYTVADIVNTITSVNSFDTFAASGNSSGDATLSATTSVDTLTISGGDAIDINLTAASDTLQISVTNTALVDTPVVGDDTVLFFDASNSAVPAERSFANILADLNVPIVTGAGNGIVVKTGETPDTYETKAVSASVVAAQEGAIVINGDLTAAGDLIVGVDIAGQTDSAVNMVAADEFLVHDGTNNVAMSGQQVADGVVDVLGLDGLQISIINSNPIMTITDATRAGKQLSVDSNMFSFGENALSDLDWIRPTGNASDADSGYIMPLDGTIVFGTGHCENTGTNAKDIHIFVNGVDEGSLGSLSGGANVQFNNNTVDIDFAAGDRIRLRAVGSGTGAIDDTVASVHVRWRAA